MADNDLQLTTLEHRKNGNCTYNLSRYLERFKYPSIHDQLKNRSSFTEYAKQNNKDLTPGFGGQFDLAKVGQDSSFSDIGMYYHSETIIICQSEVQDPEYFAYRTIPENDSDGNRCLFAGALLLIFGNSPYWVLT